MASYWRRREAAPLLLILYFLIAVYGVPKGSAELYPFSGRLKDSFSFGDRAGDRIALVGDYDASGLYDTARRQYRNVSPQRRRSELFASEECNSRSE